MVERIITPGIEKGTVNTTLEPGRSSAHLRKQDEELIIDYVAAGIGIVVVLACAAAFALGLNEPVQALEEGILAAGGLMTFQMNLKNALSRRQRLHLKAKTGTILEA